VRRNADGVAELDWWSLQRANVFADPPKDSIDEDERCKLFCRVAGSPHYYLLRDKVEDGTTCAPDTHDICVNGICKPAGCDHILDSKASLGQ